VSGGLCAVCPCPKMARYTTNKYLNVVVVVDDDDDDENDDDDDDYDNNGS